MIDRLSCDLSAYNICPDPYVLAFSDQCDKLRYDIIFSIFDLMRNGKVGHDLFDLNLSHSIQTNARD